MIILLFGKNGQIGWELNRSLQPLGEIIAFGREDADFSNPECLRNIIRNVKPGIIVNAAAYTAVDKAESEEVLAETINGIAPGVLAEEALKLGALLVHYSTDYVFDGTKESPYSEEDKPNPVNAYGRTKLVGEKSIQLSGCDHMIFRTSWVYASRCHNFLLTMLKLAQEREDLRVVNDQIGSPTSARLIADITVLCLQQVIRERSAGVFYSGLYHMTASEHTSWYGFTKEIVNFAGNSMNLKLTVKDINKITSDCFPTAAARPINSRLSLEKLESTFNVKTPKWKESLYICMAEIQ